MQNQWTVIFKIIASLRGIQGCTCKVYTANHVFAGSPQQGSLNDTHICLKEGPIEHYIQLDAIIAVTSIPPIET